MAWEPRHPQGCLIKESLCADEKIKVLIFAVICVVTQPEPRALGDYSSALILLPFQVNRSECSWFRVGA